ncbi:hypothetical protein Tcan_10006 [Toxocara canis]|uniref:Uncharacterized protein n=1 Tax=Toxocara canis TaxID=6265 RepID=A0A0B2VWA1_TOXCA|nr:hypothetical protein Tcan_10006 [Toxocara canis]
MMEHMDVHPNEKYIVGAITLTFALINFSAKSALTTLDANGRQSYRQQWRFFLQAFMSSAIIMIIFIGFHVVKKSMKLRFIHFITGCLCVIVVHGTNSIVLLVCSRELRVWLHRAITCKEQPRILLLSSSHEPRVSKISCATKISEI